MRRKAFTLVELLVVISIIALLMSILVPSLRKAREAAKKVICQNQMRQIGVAVTMYTESNDGAYPQSIGGNPMDVEQAKSSTWWGLIGPATGLEVSALEHLSQYRKASVGTIGNCPSHGSYGSAETIGGKNSFSYAGNSNFFRKWEEYIPRQGVTRNPPLKAVAVRSPSSKILVWEIFHGADWPLTMEPARRGAPHKEFLGRIGTQHGYNADGLLDNAGWGPTHGQDLNYLFADGRAEPVDHLVPMIGDKFEKPLY